MKKTSRRTLQLHTQTIRRLQTNDLQFVAGGVTYTCKPSTQNPTNDPAPKTGGAASCWCLTGGCAPTFLC
jgi:hypothetical protein